MVIIHSSLLPSVFNEHDTNNNRYAFIYRYYLLFNQNPAVRQLPHRTSPKTTPPTTTTRRTETAFRTRRPTMDRYYIILYNISKVLIERISAIRMNTMWQEMRIHTCVFHRNRLPSGNRAGWRRQGCDTDHGGVCWIICRSHFACLFIFVLMSVNSWVCVWRRQRFYH